MALERKQLAALVISDDVDLGGLVALNLRLRGFIVEQTMIALAVASRWSPSFGRPDLVIVDIEVSARVTPEQIHQLLGRPWARGVPLILAADSPALRTETQSRSEAATISRPADVGAIMTSVRELLDGAAHDRRALL